MKKLYCVICGKYRKFEKPRMSYFLGKISVFSIICIKWKNEEEKIGVAWHPVSQTSAAQRVVGTKVSWVIMFGKVGELKIWILEQPVYNKSCSSFHLPKHKKIFSECFFSSLESSMLKRKENMRLESSISGNVRNFVILELKRSIF